MTEPEPLTEQDLDDYFWEQWDELWLTMMEDQAYEAMKR